MSLRPLIRSTTTWRASIPRLRSHSALHNPSYGPSFPTTPSCPAPTCACAAMPELSLPIDRKTKLNGTMAPYAEQVLICTGRDDWASKIEEENSGDNLAADLKELLGRGGQFADPYHNISIANSSFPSTIPQRKDLENTSAFLFPSFKYIPFLPRVSFDSVTALVKGYLLPTKLHPAHDGLSPIHRDRLLRQEEYRSVLYDVQEVRDVVVLICGHGGRDQRCGELGPLLRTEFEEKLGGERLGIRREPVQILREDHQKVLGVEEDAVGKMASVGLISHIGGHKFAGNVIVYIPPGMRLRDGRENPLAGCGIWYGRVETRHVEGIVKETVLEGRVIEELFRGGIRRNREIMRL